MFHPNVPPLILCMVNGYIATDRVVVTEMDEGGDTRFASVTADDIDILVQNKDSENTKKNSKAAVAVFRGYLLEKGKCVDFISLPLEELRELLKKNYVEARRKDKNMYSKSSLIAIRFGLCKFIQLHRSELDIINGSNFKDANLVFKAKI